MLSIDYRSNPTSPNYGKHWTSHEVIAAFEPSTETLNSVRDWIVHHGSIAHERITHSDNKAWFVFEATAEEAENLLKTEYHEYVHSETGSSMAACDKYHVPKALREHIDFITPGVKGARLAPRLDKRGVEASRKHGHRRPKPKPVPDELSRFITAEDLSTCDVAITPACIRALYDIPLQNPNANVSSNNSMGIFEMGDFYSQKDLNLFYANFTPYIPKGTKPIANLIDGEIGPVPADYAGGEASLDFQLAIPIIYPQNTTLYEVDDPYYTVSGRSNRTGIFNTFLDAIDGSYCTYSAYGETGNDPVLDPIYPNPHKYGYKGDLMCGVYKPTNVISISYGEQEQDLPAYYQKRQCDEFLKLGLQGVSIFVASGDTGVGGLHGDGANKNGCLGDGTIFSPTQPNSCPWLTNVGASKVYEGNSIHDPESAANVPQGWKNDSHYSSGGGFSNLFTAPDYQIDAIDKFFTDHDPGYPYYTDGQYNSSDGGIYNRNGRGIPDVAANGDNIVIYLGGEPATMYGTSASAPIFAAVINRIIEARLAVGKGPVGFINPVLYQNPQVLNDIVNGTNPGCGSKGFAAVEGWDPVTGLGTPNYPKMEELWLGLP